MPWKKDTSKYWNMLVDIVVPRNDIPLMLNFRTARKYAQKELRECSGETTFEYHRELFTALETYDCSQYFLQQKLLTVLVRPIFHQILNICICCIDLPLDFSRTFDPASFSNSAHFLKDSLYVVPYQVDIVEGSESVVEFESLDSSIYENTTCRVLLRPFFHACLMEKDIKIVIPFSFPQSQRI